MRRIIALALVPALAGKVLRIGDGGRQEDLSLLANFEGVTPTVRPG
jgi:hypothetical protein